MSLRRIPALIALGAIAVVVSPVSRAADQPIAYWTGDSTTSDASGNGHTGTLLNGATYGVGAFGAAFAFAGGDDVFSAPHSTAFNFGTGNFAFTLRFNANTTPSNATAGLLSKDNWSGGSSYTGFLANFCTLTSGPLACNPAGLGAEVRNGSSQDIHARTMSFGLTPDTWHSLTVSRNAGVVTTHIDGILAASASESTPINVNNSAPVTIGALNYATASPTGVQNFSGRIDDIAFFNRSLTPAEILAIHADGVAATFFPTPPPPPPPFDPGPIAHWKGDGTAIDSTGNGHNGEMRNGAGYAPGLFGQAFRLDGRDDLVRIPHHDDFAFGTGDFSYSLWYNADDVVTNGTAGLIGKDSWTGGTTFAGWLANFCTETSALIACNPVGLGGEIRRAGSGDVHARTSSAGLVPDTWYNLTVTRHSGVQTTYIDGIPVATATEATPIDISTASDLTIGALNLNSAFPNGLQHFSGLIDDVRIYNRALSPAEVASIYESGVPATSVPSPTSCSLFLLAVAGLLSIRNASALMS